MIKSNHDNRKHRNGFGRRGPVFEVKCWRLAVTISWCISWFITTKGFELIQISSKNWWEEVMATDDEEISLVPNYFAEFPNSLLHNAEIRNNFLERCCIIFGGRRRTKTMRALI